jgi:ATP-dependent DNA helicase RecQ
MAAQSPSQLDLLKTLKSVFGYDSFRPLQEEIVGSILAERDVFVLMPTGGGKSLCYQLPALMKDGVTVVVSPLIALMKDQVDALRELGVAATYINSSLDASEVRTRQEAVAQGRVKLLYVAPERLMMPGFLKMLAALGARLAGFAIDEAHCISEWGHDFRPEYRELIRLRELFPGVPLGSFTATATARVQADIKQQLALGGADAYRGSFNRPNLYYEVRPKQRAYGQLVAYLGKSSQASGIIYCLSRAGTEDLADRLRADRFSAAAYHAGLSADQRRRRQEAFIRDDVRIIVATIAFGMGIDKPDVRFVIHYDLPKSLEGYYQESGRAGRDGEPSDCILFYSIADVIKLRRFIGEKEGVAGRNVALWQLKQMSALAESTFCRRAALLAYFDDTLSDQGERCCDICSQPVEQEDATIAAQMFLSCVKRTGERFGMSHVIDVLRGSRNRRVLDSHHDSLSTYGIGRDRSQEEWGHIGRELIRCGYALQNEQRFSALEVTERGGGVLFRGERVMTSRPRKPARDSASVVDQPHEDLFERLRALRKHMADTRGIAPYMIFHDTVLRHMAAGLPSTDAQLLRISGIGARKARDFGPEILAAIGEYVRETGAEPVQVEVPVELERQLKGSLGKTVRDSVRLFRAGKDVAAIARERGFILRTIETHLSQAIEAGEPIDIDRLVEPERRRRIEAVMREQGYEVLAPIREELGEGFSYGELQLVRAALRRAEIESK